MSTIALNPSRLPTIGPVGRTIVRRLLLSIPLLFFVSALVFTLLTFAPGDAALQQLGFRATPAALARLRSHLGLDLPLYQQYLRWLEHALRGDFGISVSDAEPVSRIIADRFPVTLSLVAAALVLMVVIGIPVGVYAAVRGGLIGSGVDSLAVVGFSLPAFWVAATLVAIFSVRLHWFPAVGYVALSQSLWGWLQSLVLPVVALSLGGIAIVAKNTREAMLDALASEHVRMARANGIPPRRIYLVYALKTAAVRLTTVLGILVVGLLAGTVLVETVFALPGLGSALVAGVRAEDLPVTQGIVVFFTAIIVTINLAIDLLYVLIDPRVRIK